MTDTTDAQVRAFEMAIERDDLQANDLSLKTIGAWTVVGHKRNAQGRNIFVLRHADGFVKGVKGYVLNAMLTEARLNGVTVS